METVFHVYKNGLKGTGVTHKYYYKRICKNGDEM